MIGFDFEEERIKQEITKLDAKRVLLQLPEGLKPEALRLSKLIESIGALPIVSGDPCYGACDVATSEADDLGVDLIIHFGHSKLLKHGKIPTIYFEVRATISVVEAVLSSLTFLEGYNRIGLVTTIQHVQTLYAVRDILSKAGKTIVIGAKGGALYPGQVIGCDYSIVKSIAANVDAFLFVGGGRFHAIGVALAGSKPTVVADPYAQSAYTLDIEVQKILKQRYASIEEAKRAKNWGVLISLKPGQKHLDLAMKIKKSIDNMDKSAFLLVIREILPEVLMEFPTIDAYVNTACPRISVDDASKFKKPILTMNEFMVVSGESTWENMLKKGLFEN